MPTAPRLRQALAALSGAAALWWIAGCGGVAEEAPTGGGSLFENPFAVELLVEQASPGGPRTEGPNRLFGGWVPIEVGGRGGFLASARGASIEVVTLEPRKRTLTLDLLDDGRLSRLAQVHVRVDRGEPFSAPVIDPLTIPLPPDLAPGRHLVEIFPRTPGEPPLLVAGARLKPALEPGTGALDGDTLVQSGPSVVDVATVPPGPTPGQSNATLTGDLCVQGALAGTGGFALAVTDTGGRTLGRWEGGTGILDRLSGCRTFELPVPVAAGPSREPVRVRLTAADSGRTGRWTARWASPDAAPTAAGEGDAARTGATERGVPEPADPPRLVLVYLMDALRADFVGHLGGPDGVSPVVDRLAREGFTFRAHRSNAPNTLPSMRELFTGRIYLDQTGWDRLSPDRPTLAERFRSAGYRTGLFSGNEYVSATYGLARGFDHVSQEALYDVRANRRVNRNAEQVHAATLAWLETVPDDEPVFLYLHTIHPHNPYAPPPEIESRFTAGIPSAIRGDTEVLQDLEHGRRQATDADRARLRGLYAGSLAYDDRELGKLLATLGERFAPEETVVIVTSDHGEELFDHGGTLHGYTLYEEMLRIPLVVWAPGRVPPGETTRATDTLDLHATLADLASSLESNPQTGERAGSEGRALLPLLAGSQAPEPGPRYAATWGIPGGVFSIRNGRWKLIEVAGTERGSWMGIGPGRSRERRYLYDLDEDPGETENLTGTGGVREQWLLARLHAWIARQRSEAAGAPAADSPDAPADSPTEPPLDEETRERLRALGYLD